MTNDKTLESESSLSLVGSRGGYAEEALVLSSDTALVHRAGNQFKAQPVYKPQVHLAEVSDSPVLYVGIGSSSGGMKALKEFFDHMSPTSGAAFMVVQHLSADFDSFLDDLLPYNTSMPVRNVVNGVEVLANTIYLKPPRKSMTLHNGRLYLHEQNHDDGVDVPVDKFFKSLAADAEHRAVGIVLSGTGSDGSSGIKAVRKAGGMVLVQDGVSSKYKGMPDNAAQTGVADFVLPPEELAVYLSTFLNVSMVQGGRPEERVVDDTEAVVLSQIFSLLLVNTGIDFRRYKLSMVARRIERRMGVNRVQGQAGYLHLLQISTAELEALCSELLEKTTGFFKDETVWDYLFKHVLVPIVKSARIDEELRFWVAGCSTGEEAYSLAMAVDEVMQELGVYARVKIYATDVDVTAISKASTARYASETVNDMSSERLERYFIKVGEEYEIRPHIRMMVVFTTHNLIEDTPFSNMQLITCRNVLVCFQESVQRQVMSAFHSSLEENGKAVFGFAESLADTRDHFRAVHDTFKVYEKHYAVASEEVENELVISEETGAEMQPVFNLLGRYFLRSRNSSRSDTMKNQLINELMCKQEQLENENDKLASIVEELRSSNEHLKACNEELVSINRKLSSGCVDVILEPLVEGAETC